ncbi:MAG TPA: GNAT family N-acetyltransferase [Anaerolineales bacterium]|nr:GNAT family N-acetyltransferase [Anaerolineales bacterium]
MPLAAISYHIDTANWRDLGALRHLEQVCFPQDAWPLLDLIAVLTYPNIVRLKAVYNQKMIGFIAGDRKSSQLAWIATIGVLPEFRGRGIGAALLMECETRLNVSSIRLNVRQKNEAAIRLYEGFGYRRIDAWPRYYTDGATALVYEKIFP